VDTCAPLTFSHLHLKLKKLKVHAQFCPGQGLSPPCDADFQVLTLSCLSHGWGDSWESLYSVALE
jgi:hypothetical protein